MQDAALVQVEVTEHDGKKTYGTAYLINKDCAITALHVVENYKAIQFNFSNGKNISKEIHFEIAYSNKDYDLAIVRFMPFDDCLPEVGTVLIGAKSSVDDGWHGAGYPKFAEKNGQRLQDDPEELKGKCYQLIEKKKRLKLSCTEIPKLDKWGGVSGAPVFLNKNKQLVAIITQHDTALENTHFKAAPLWVLCKDAGFKDILNSATLDTHYFHQKKLAGLLKKIDGLDSSTEEILEKDFSEIIETFKQVKSQDNDKPLEEALLSVLTAKYEQVPRLLDTPNAEQPFFSVSVARLSTSELLMAAESQRAPEFCKIWEVNKSGKEVPKIVPNTILNLACPPEYGIDGYDDKEVLAALAAAKANEKFVTERLFGDFDPEPTDMDAGYDDDDKEYYAKRILNDAKGQYYWAVKVNDKNREAIAKIHKALPLLKILNLNKDRDINYEEQVLFKELTEFLPDSKD